MPDHASCGGPRPMHRPIVLVDILSSIGQYTGVSVEYQLMYWPILLSVHILGGSPRLRPYFTDTSPMLHRYFTFTECIGWYRLIYWLIHWLTLDRSINALVSVDVSADTLVDTLVDSTRYLSIYRWVVSSITWYIGRYIGRWYRHIGSVSVDSIGRYISR